MLMLTPSKLLVLKPATALLYHLRKGGSPIEACTWYRITSMPKITTTKWPQAVVPLPTTVTAALDLKNNLKLLNCVVVEVQSSHGGQNRKQGLAKHHGNTR
ncbi:unnamed protein product [Laminaria digitata]